MLKANIRVATPQRKRNASATLDPESTGKRLKTNLVESSESCVPVRSTSVQVQPFSMLSRRASSSIGFKPADLELLTPPRLLGTLGCTVTCCACSWARLQHGSRRLCKRDTSDHEEYELLLSMNKRFIADCSTGGGLLTSRACHKETNVHFVTSLAEGRKGLPAVVGYVAFTPNYSHQVTPNLPNISSSLANSARRASPRVPLLVQIFVEPEQRQKGIALEALRQLLDGCAEIAVDAPTKATMIILEKLHFRFVGARDNGEGQGLGLFIREAVATSGALHSQPRFMN